jgi:co-chaperonin GroES (HSP10)
LKTSKTAAAVAEVGSNEEIRKWLEGLNDEDLVIMREDDVLGIVAEDA